MLHCFFSPKSIIRPISSSSSALGRAAYQPNRSVASQMSCSWSSAVNVSFFLKASKSRCARAIDCSGRSGMEAGRWRSLMKFSVSSGLVRYAEAAASGNSSLRRSNSRRAATDPRSAPQHSLRSGRAVRFRETQSRGEQRGSTEFRTNPREFVANPAACQHVPKPPRNLYKTHAHRFLR